MFFLPLFPLGGVLQIEGAGGGVALFSSKKIWSVPPSEESADCPEWSDMREQVISEMTTEGFEGGKEKEKDLILPEKSKLQIEEIP